MAEDFIRVKTKGYNTLEDLAKEYGIGYPNEIWTIS